MAVIKSGDSTTELTVDTTSKSARVTLYNTDGTTSAPYTSYRAATAADLVAAAGVSPFFAIQGSATKTIRVRKIIVTNPTLTATAVNSIVCKKTSTAITGGTATALVQVPLDSTSAAGTASLLNVYTVAPTAGTLVGVVDNKRLILGDTAPVAGASPLEVVFDFGDKGLVLRGVAEGLSLNFIAAPATSVTMNLMILYSEE